MYKFLMTSILVRVALGQTMLMAAALYFIATHFTPDATYVTASGTVRHVFLSGPFLRQVVIGWIIILPVSYLATRIVMWVTGIKS